MSAYCDHCDLPLATCVHGLRAAAPATAASVDSSRHPSVGSQRRLQSAINSSRRTPQRDFRAFILRVLQDRRGRGEVDAVLAEVESRMAEALTDGDYELVDNDEVRWRNAARWERKDMVADGLIAPSEQRGIWQLTPKGMATPPEGGL